MPNNFPNSNRNNYDINQAIFKGIIDYLPRYDCDRNDMEDFLCYTHNFNRRQKLGVSIIQNMMRNHE